MINLTMNILALLVWIVLLITVWAILPSSWRKLIIKKMVGCFAHLRCLWTEVKEEVKKERSVRSV